MILSGDEIGRTQRGNNNAYCQDNEISWLNWRQADKDLLDFTTKLIKLYKTHPVFSRRRWFQGQHIKGRGVEDIAWFLPDGNEMSEENWTSDFAKSLAVYMSGHGIRSLDTKGQRVIDDDFYIIFNAYQDSLEFRLPPEKYGEEWIRVLDTDANYIREDGEVYRSGEMVGVSGRSVVLLKHS